jgi:hypothetical protein
MWVEFHLYNTIMCDTTVNSVERPLPNTQVVLVNPLVIRSLGAAFVCNILKYFNGPLCVLIAISNFGDSDKLPTGTKAMLVESGEFVWKRLVSKATKEVGLSRSPVKSQSLDMRVEPGSSRGFLQGGNFQKRVRQDDF